MKVFEVAKSGMDVEWQRLTLIAENLANMNTVRTPDGDTYRAKRLLTGPDLAFDQVLSGANLNSPAGVRVYSVERSESAPFKVNDPNHPYADLEGNVIYSNVNHAEEMALALKTSRVYEANMAMFSIARQTYASALNIGRA